MLPGIKQWKSEPGLESMQSSKGNPQHQKNQSTLKFLTEETRKKLVLPVNTEKLEWDEWKNEKENK